MEVLSVLGEEGQHNLEQVSDFSFSFEHLVKILVSRLEAVNDRVDALEKKFDQKTADLLQEIGTLTHNIQGFSDNSEKCVSFLRLESGEGPLLRKINFQRRGREGSKQPTNQAPLKTHSKRNETKRNEMKPTAGRKPCLCLDPSCCIQ